MHITCPIRSVVSIIHRVVLAIALFASAAGVIAEEEKKGPDFGPIVQNLCEAQQNGSPLFHQTKDRTLLDRFFTKELADKLWKDAQAAKGEPGSLDFDVLLGTGAAKITKFKVGETHYGKYRQDEYIPYEGFAIVDVTFTASGTAKYVSYLITTEGRDKGKIRNIHYDGLPSLDDALNR